MMERDGKEELDEEMLAKGDDVDTNRYRVSARGYQTLNPIVKNVSKLESIPILS